MSTTAVDNVSGMKDCTGREYAVEDFVSFIRPFHHDMAVGKVVRFTPKCIKVLELKPEIDVTGRMVVRPAKSNVEHTVRPGNAAIINETADTWLFIPWAD